MAFIEGAIVRIFGLGMMTRMKAQLLDSRIGNLTQDEFERNLKTLRIFRKLVEPNAILIFAVFLISVFAPITIILYYIAVDDFAQGKRTLFGMFCSIFLTAVAVVLFTVVIVAYDW